MATDPGTRSPGSLVLFYTDRGHDHSCSVALVAGVDINGVAALRTDATALASLVAALLPNNRSIVAWGIKPKPAGSSYREAFGTPFPGTHGTDSGTTDFFSFTWSIMGRAAGTGVGAARGSTRMVLHVGNIHVIGAGDLIYTGATDAALTALTAALSASTRFYADYYGQKADPTGRVTVQFNAHTQRTLGL
jgi:hypothetical protein